MRPNSLVRSIPFLVLAGSAAGPVSAHYWSRSVGVAPTQSSDTGDKDAVPDLAGKTMRQTYRLSIGGDRLRLRLSNEMTPVPLHLGKVDVALVDANGRTVAGSDRVVTFGGRSDVRIGAHQPLVSDPIALPTTALAHVSVSLYFPDGAPRATWHSYAGATTLIAAGEQTGSPTLSAAGKWDHRLVVTALDVERAQRGDVVVALGDSITDGGLATPDTDRRWPDQLAARLQKAGTTGIGVANAGISSNRLLADGYGPSVSARFDRDVLAVPGVRTVITLIGINDICRAVDAGLPPPSAASLIDGYRQLVARAHDNGVRIIFGTITPYGGTGYWRADGEAVRTTVNTWIRTNREADGAADFDEAIRDPADPTRMLHGYDSGDGLHPNDAGLAAMTEAIDLRLLRRDR